VATVSTALGFILLNEELNPVAFNAAALQILAYPTEPGRIHQPLLFVRDKVRFRLLAVNGGSGTSFCA
jgi:hypothetical protein